MANFYGWIFIHTNGQNVVFKGNQTAHSFIFHWFHQLHCKTHAKLPSYLWLTHFPIVIAVVGVSQGRTHRQKAQIFDQCVTFLCCFVFYVSTLQYSTSGKQAKVQSHTHTYPERRMCIDHFCSISEICQYICNTSASWIVIVLIR